MKNGPYEFIIAPKNYPGRIYRDKYCYEHHYVYWKHTGNIIKPKENIHHINGNKRDNNFQNLDVMTRSDHIALHNPDKKKHPSPRIEVSCENCGKQYDIDSRKHKWKKKNNKHFFCSRHCIGKFIGTGRGSSTGGASGC